MLSPSIVQQVFDQGLLFGIKGDNADREVPDLGVLVSQTSNSLVHDRFCFSLIVTSTATSVERIGAHETDCVIYYFGSRKGDQFIAVIAIVRKSDQALIVRSIVQI